MKEMGSCVMKSCEIICLSEKKNIFTVTGECYHVQFGILANLAEQTARKQNFGTEDADTSFRIPG